MVDEFIAVIKNDLKIGEEDSAGSNGSYDESKETKDRNATEEKALLREFGINTDIFDQTMSLFTESSNMFEAQMASCVRSLMQDVDQIQE